MTSEEPLLNPRCCAACFRGGSGVNGFAQRFAGLRSFAAKNLRSVENNPERILARAWGKGSRVPAFSDKLDTGRKRLCTRFRFCFDNKFSPKLRQIVEQNRMFWMTR